MANVICLLQLLVQPRKTHPSVTMMMSPLRRLPAESAKNERKKEKRKR